MCSDIYIYLHMYCLLHAMLWNTPAHVHVLCVYFRVMCVLMDTGNKPYECVQPHTCKHSTGRERCGDRVEGVVTSNRPDLSSKAPFFSVCLLVVAFY